MREGWGVVQGVAFRRFPDLGAARVGGKNLWLGLKPPASAAPRGLPSLLGRTATFVPAVDEIAVQFPDRNGPGVRAGESEAASTQRGPQGDTHAINQLTSLSHRD